VWKSRFDSAELEALDTKRNLVSQQPEYVFGGAGFEKARQLVADDKVMLDSPEKSQLRACN
jgi:hypothetical protein